VQLGTLSFPAQIDSTQPSNVVNQTTCGDIQRDQPICSSIEMARLVFYEIINMQYLLLPNTYFWQNISFGREGSSIFGNTSNPRDTIIDCGGSRCFEFCKAPVYVKGLSKRCFPPINLEYLTFRNGFVKDGNGGVMNNFPAVLVLQRRPVVLAHLIFEHNVVKNGSGGALAFGNRQERASITMHDVVFHSNEVYGGAGGALYIDSSEFTGSQLKFFNNSALVGGFYSTLVSNNTYYNTTNSSSTTNSTGTTNNTGTTNSSNTTRTNSTSNSTDNYVPSSSSSSTIPNNPLSDQLTPRPSILVNMTGSGGAIAVTASQTGSVVTLSDSKVYSNTAENSGGGIFLLRSKLYVIPGTTNPSEVLLTNNTASLGGNIYIESSSVIGKRSESNTGPFHFVVRSGSAANFGGGMVCVGSTLDINWSLFEYNSAGISGGGLYGVLCLMNGVLSVFRHNEAGNSGGGAMFFQSISNIVLDRITVNNNFASGPGGGISAIECRSFFLTASSIFLNSASEGGGLYLIEILSRPEIQNDLIKDNTARDGGGGGLLWDKQQPLLLRTEIEQNVHRLQDDVMSMFSGNVAQYGSQIASGIVALTSTMPMERNAFFNTKAFDPEITVFVLDHYNNLVRRRNRPTSVIASVKSGKCISAACTDRSCIHTPDQYALSTCPTVSQALFGKPVQEIPGLAGTVNFTGLGLRGWPGNHTLRLEIPGISQIYRVVNIYDCMRGQYLQKEEGIDGGACMNCPSGWAKNVTGIFPCHACNAGFACAAGSFVPKSCVPGEYQDRNEQQNCLSCSPGRYTNATEMLHCFSCIGGKYSAFPGSTTCDECVAGRSTSSANSVICQSCDSGRYAPLNASLKCSNCPSGYSKNGTGNVGCNICLEGTYASNVGGFFCLTCDEGSIAPMEGAIGCASCLAGQFANQSKICSGKQQEQQLRVVERVSYVRFICVVCPNWGCCIL
jgi:hypothetical protein